MIPRNSFPPGFLAHEFAVFADPPRVLIIKVVAIAGETRLLTATLDRWIDSFRFSFDGRWIYFTYANFGAVHLARVNLRDGAVETLIEGARQITSFDIDRNGNVAAVLNEANDSGELYLLSSRRLRRLTGVNDAYIANRRLGSKTSVTYSVADGTEVQAFVTLPPDHIAGRRYPTVLDIHGGPVGQFAWGYDFGAQFLAANGYVVLQPKRRDSAQPRAARAIVT